MHPAIALLFSAILRVAALCLAWFRVFSLGLVGVDEFVPYLPALALLYFVLSPKPRAGSNLHVAVSGAVFLCGAAVSVSEWLTRRPDATCIDEPELIVMAISLALHVAYRQWKNRGPEWAWWSRFLGRIPDEVR